MSRARGAPASACSPRTQSARRRRGARGRGRRARRTPQRPARAGRARIERPRAPQGAPRRQTSRVPPPPPPRAPQRQSHTHAQRMSEGAPRRPPPPRHSKVLAPSQLTPPPTRGALRGRTSGRQGSQRGCANKRDSVVLHAVSPPRPSWPTNQATQETKHSGGPAAPVIGRKSGVALQNRASACVVRCCTCSERTVKHLHPVFSLCQLSHCSDAARARNRAPAPVARAVKGRECVKRGPLALAVAHRRWFSGRSARARGAAAWAGDKDGSGGARSHDARAAQPPRAAPRQWQ